MKTPSARSKIRSYFSKITRSDDMQMGRDMLVREMRKHVLGLSSAQSMRALKLVAEALGVPKSRVGVASGHTARRKRLSVEADQAQVDAWLASLPRC